MLQVPLPEQPDTEDETVLKKWKWEVRSAQKENKERYALRCDVELKLEVRAITHTIETTTAISCNIDGNSVF